MAGTTDGIDLKRLGDAIKTKRAMAKLQQAEAAAEIGITPATLSRYENGHYLPTLDIYRRICDWLGLGMDYFARKSA